MRGTQWTLSDKDKGYCLGCQELTSPGSVSSCSFREVSRFYIPRPIAGGKKSSSSHPTLERHLIRSFTPSKSLLECFGRNNAGRGQHWIQQECLRCTSGAGRLRGEELWARGPSLCPWLTAHGWPPYLPPVALTHWLLWAVTSQSSVYAVICQPLLPFQAFLQAVLCAWEVFVHTPLTS